MSLTLLDKIWNAHVVREEPGGAAILYIDRHLVHEVTSPQAFEGLRMAGRKVRRPESTFAVPDHNVPTKDREIRTLPLGEIQGYVNDFIGYTNAHPDLAFKVTRIGCGLAGYTDDQIAPFFAGAPENCILPKGWRAAWDA